MPGRVPAWQHRHVGRGSTPACSILPSRAAHRARGRCCPQPPLPHGSALLCSALGTVARQGHREVRVAGGRPCRAIPGGGGRSAEPAGRCVSPELHLAGPSRAPRRAEPSHPHGGGGRRPSPPRKAPPVAIGHSAARICRSYLSFRDSSLKHRWKCSQVAFMSS